MKKISRAVDIFFAIRPPVLGHYDKVNTGAHYDYIASADHILTLTIQHLMSMSKI